LIKLSEVTSQIKRDSTTETVLLGKYWSFRPSKQVGRRFGDGRRILHSLSEIPFFGEEAKAAPISLCSVCRNSVRTNSNGLEKKIESREVPDSLSM
jgi:hypothetical protein